MRHRRAAGLFMTAAQEANGLAAAKAASITQTLIAPSFTMPSFTVVVLGFRPVGAGG